MTDGWTDGPMDQWAKCSFYESGAIWNIPTKFQTNQLRNDDFSQLKLIMTNSDRWTDGPMDQFQKFIFN